MAVPHCKPVKASGAAGPQLFAFGFLQALYRRGKISAAVAGTGRAVSSTIHAAIS